MHIPLLLASQPAQRAIRPIAGASSDRRGRRRERGRMVELSAEDAGPVLRAFPTEVPTGVGFMRRSGLVTDGRPEEFEALAGRCAVFRLDPLRA